MTENEIRLRAMCDEDEVYFNFSSFDIIDLLDEIDRLRDQLQ